MRYHFDIIENGGATGGVAGHHFEKGIGERRDGAVDHERQGAQGGNQDPAESGDEDPVFNTQLMLFPEKPPEGNPEQQGYPGRYQQRYQIVPGIDHGTDDRQHHGDTGDQEEGT